MQNRGTQLITKRKMSIDMKKLDIFNPQVATSGVDKQYKLRPLLLTGCIFVACIVITNVIGTKIMTFLGFNFTAGVITYALVFLCTDLISDIWGKRTAYYFVFVGFLANLILILFVQVAIISPPADFWIDNQAAYEQTLGAVWVIVVASMIAYLVSQIHDIWAFHFWKTKTKGEHLWFRNIMSTITSQTIDTILFIGIAFGLSLSFSQLFTMIVGQIIVKWCLAIMDTPFIYLFKYLLGGEVQVKDED